MSDFKIFNRKITPLEKLIFRLVWFILGLYGLVLYAKMSMVLAWYTVEMIKGLNVPDWCVDLCQNIDCPMLSGFMVVLAFIPISFWIFLFRFEYKDFAVVIVCFTYVLFILGHAYFEPKFKLDVFKKYGHDTFYAYLHEKGEEQRSKSGCNRWLTFVYTKDGVEHKVTKKYTCEWSPKLGSKFIIAVSKVNPRLFYIFETKKKKNIYGFKGYKSRFYRGHHIQYKLCV